MFKNENRAKKIENKSMEIQNRNVLNLVFGVLFILFFSLSVNAQCAMCRAALESEGNSVKAQAVNDGIVYLMIIPYVLFVAVAYAVYKMRLKKKA